MSMMKYTALIMGLSVSGLYGMEEQKALDLADGFVVKKTDDQSDPVECIEESEFDKSQQAQQQAKHKNIIPSQTQTPEQIKQNVNDTQGAQLVRNKVAVRNLNIHKNPSHTAWSRSFFGCCRRKR